MNTEESEDFFLEGGDELINSEPCPKRGESIYLNRAIKWVDRKGKKVKVLK